MSHIPGGREGSCCPCTPAAEDTRSDYIAGSCSLNGSRPGSLHVGRANDRDGRRDDRRSDLFGHRNDDHRNGGCHTGDRRSGGHHSGGHHSGGHHSDDHYNLANPYTTYLRERL